MPKKQAKAVKRAVKKATKKAVKGTKKAAKTAMRRADFGAPIDVALNKQPPHLRAILDALRAIIEEVAPDAKSALKWGMPFYCIDGKMMCALGAHKAHVNLILAGPPEEFVDPLQRLQGEGKSGRRLTLRDVSELPHKEVKAWVKTAAKCAKAGKTTM